MPTETANETARARLLELLHKRTLADRMEIAHGFTPIGSINYATVFVLTRYQSRSRETKIVDFLVIRDDQPTSIAAEIAELLSLNGDLAAYPSQYSGILMTKSRPEDIVNRLSMALFGKYCLEIREL